jgi:hypothetical protein
MFDMNCTQEDGSSLVGESEVRVEGLRDLLLTRSCMTITTTWAVWQWWHIKNRVAGGLVYEVKI